MNDVSRSRIRKWIDEGDVLVNGDQVKAGYKLRIGDQIEVEEPEPEELLSAAPEPMDLEIVYEDEDLAIVNKPQGMVVHPSAGHPNGTLVNGLMYHFQGQLSGINGVLRPGIVHRIDKDTSGLLVICKSDQAHHALSAMLADHDITRKYHAIVYG
ncbi:MAG: RluA family pseudouridine synthase, partial [Clostridiales bacterium]|nr:RluA family pseudouridine synthase [Clostridiales bacterium]